MTKTRWSRRPWHAGDIPIAIPGEAILQTQAKPLLIDCGVDGLGTPELRCDCFGLRANDVS